MSGLIAYFTRAEDRLPHVLDVMTTHLAVTPSVRTSYTRLHPGSAVGTASLGVFSWETRSPVRSPDGEVALWMVGEFFHHDQRLGEVARRAGVDLQDDLGKFALEVYRSDGVQGLAALSGTFQIAIWDSGARELVLVNDRLGFYPHYVYQRGQTFVLAPSLRALVAAPEVAAVPDEVAIAQFLRFQQILGNRSWVRDVSLLPPATIVRFRSRDGAMTVHRYRDWDQVRPYGRVDAGDALDECSRLFERSVVARTRRGRTALLLSGGLDSRTILAFTPEPTRQLTLTYGASGSLDVTIAEKIARTAGSPHEWDPYEDGRWVQHIADTYVGLTDGVQSAIHGHGLSTVERVKDRTDAVLTGWGGGTILGGYLDSYELDAKYRALTDEEALTQALYDAFCRRLTWPGLIDAEEHQLTASVAGQRLRGLALESFREEFRLTSHYDPAVRLDGFYIDQHERRCTLYMHVMARGFVEARAPFKDDDLTSYFLSLPETVRRSPWLIRAILHRRSPALAAIPYERDGLPPHPNTIIRGSHSVRRRTSMAWHRARRRHPPTRLYADYEHYLRTDLRSWAEDLLFSDQSRARGWFNPDAVTTLWARHLSGRELWTIGKVMPLVTIEQVMRHLFEPSAAAANVPDTRLAQVDDGRLPASVSGWRTATQT